jgi:polyphosphate glucokinase
VVDVGGNNVKVHLTGKRGPLKIPSGPKLTAAAMAAAVRKATAAWQFDVVTIGFPGPVVDDRPRNEPVNLGRGWVRFDYRKAFGRPVRMINDAAMQALGSYHGGEMLFLGLGTGLGSTLIIDGVIAPMELAHLPYKKGRTFEDHVGERGRKRYGTRRWTRHVADVVARLRHALQADEVVLGGGNARKLAALPEGVRLGDNANAFRGGALLWREPAARRR